MNIDVNFYMEFDLTKIFSERYSFWHYKHTWKECLQRHIITCTTMNKRSIHTFLLTKYFYLPTNINGKIQQSKCISSGYRLEKRGRSIKTCEKNVKLCVRMWNWITRTKTKIFWKRNYALGKVLLVLFLVLYFESCFRFRI